MQGQNKAEAVASKTKVNMAMTQHDSIFPQIKLPGGISSKATEYKELALKGDSWESPVFKLGSASSSNDIPSAPQVARKDHSVTQGGVRGPQNIGNTSSMSNNVADPVAQSAGTTNGSASNGQFAFSNQVDQAFSKEGTPNTGLNGSANGVANGKTNGHTQLGANNPVFAGST
jgi:Protein of unknown function (DUF4449)